MNFEYILDKIPNLNELEVLDIFAREGNWQSFHLHDKVKSIEAWDIEESYMPELRKNLPNAIIQCRDSIEFIKNTKNYKRFDLLVIDNGLNCYGKDREYCEHFDVINHINNIVKDECFVIFNVVTNPFNYSLYPDWINRRNNFYGIPDTSRLSSSFINNFYIKLFNSLGFYTKNYYTICREYYNDIDYLYYVAVELKKI
jgi:hypothetical protein